MTESNGSGTQTPLSTLDDSPETFDQVRAAKLNLPYLGPDPQPSLLAGRALAVGAILTAALRL